MNKFVIVLVGVFLLFACDGKDKLTKLKKSIDVNTSKIEAGMSHITYTANNIQQTKEFEGTTIVKEFLKDSKVTTLTIPNGVITIGDSAFAGNQLTEITIPKSVTTIGRGAFVKNLLTQITLSKDLYTKLEQAKRLVEIFGNVMRYQAHDGTVLKLQVIYIAKGMQQTKEFEGTIITEKFLDNRNITDITIPYGVMTIGKRAFAKNSLTELTIPNSVTTIVNSAFAENSLTELTIPNSVTIIHDSAFAVNKLTKLTIPGSVKIIDTTTFSDNKLTELIISEGVEEIRHSAFARNQLTEITIPESVTTIGDMVFSANPQLTKVTLSSTLYQNIKEANKLTNIFGAGVTYKDHEGTALH